MQPRQGSIIEAGGRAVHVLEEGEGVPVVLVHGFGTLAQEILSGFSGAPGLRLIAPDRPGYGFSEPLAAGPMGPDAQGAWLADVIDALDLDRPVVVGHSFGASVALNLAARASDRLSRLMLVAPFCRPTPQPSAAILRLAASPVIGDYIRGAVLPRLLPVIGPSRMADVLRPAPVPDYLADFPYAHLVRPEAVLSMAAEIDAFNGCMARWPEAAERFEGPIRIVAGALDTVAAPDRHVEWLRSLLPGAGILVIDGAGHAPHHGEREQVVSELVTFVHGPDRETSPPAVRQASMQAAAE